MSAASGLVLARQTAASTEPIQPIEAARITQPAVVELGKKLYFDPRLSRSGAISCNSCHNLAAGGSDNLPTSIGDRWQQGPINSPTVLNSRYNLAQFWDGRAATLKAQAGGPIANPGEMASTHELAVETLRSIPGYRDEFRRAFGSEAIDLDRVTTAIATFEETLVTPDSRFDRWLKGDRKALNATELAGYALFKSNGCIGCHNGPAVGGASFQKLGLVEPYATANPAIGRAGVTGKEADRNVFKVPTLRNVELTYPYFHDGSVSDLKDAVQIMGRVQLGRQIGDDDAGRIVAFLRTLTGNQPAIVLPQLPPSVAGTPAPRPF
nr:cytochrome-c peroxidase [Derxia lacustris]